MKMIFFFDLQIKAFFFERLIVIFCVRRQPDSPCSSERNINCITPFTFNFVVVRYIAYPLSTRAQGTHAQVFKG